MMNPNDSLITSDPAINGGQPTIAGTRISVKLIQEKVQAGETIETLLQDYPHLTRKQVEAAIRWRE